MKIIPQYEEPKMCFILLQCTDIITTSAGGNQGGNNIGEDNNENGGEWANEW